MAHRLDQGLPQSPTQPDNVHYTVFIRLPFPRGDFVDPPSVSFPVSRYGPNSANGEQVDWNANKDRELSDLLSKATAKGRDIDCETWAHMDAFGGS